MGIFSKNIVHHIQFHFGLKAQINLAQWHRLGFIEHRVHWFALQGQLHPSKNIVHHIQFYCGLKAQINLVQWHRLGFIEHRVHWFALQGQLKNVEESNKSATFNLYPTFSLV